MTEATNTRSLTYGEQLVGLSFNPSGDPKVQEVKERYAAIIDDLKSHPMSGDPVQEELQKAAIADALRAQMMAVKLITWKM